MVAVAPVNSAQILLAVVDSGSPISVADARLFQRSGIDTERDKPIYDVPLTIGGGDGLTRSRPPSQSAQIVGSVRRSPTVFGGVVGRDLCHLWRDIDPNEPACEVGAERAPSEALMR